MQVRVAVSDSGNPARTTEATIDIDIHNVNEPPTQIEVTDVNTKENLEGLAIAKFKVTDPDANNSFRYSVDDPRFEVVDGILRLKSGQFLRSSVASTFTVNVVVEDAADPTLRLSKAFTFNVQANANPWQNPINRLDTNNDGRITPWTCW